MNYLSNNSKNEIKIDAVSDLLSDIIMRIIIKEKNCNHDKVVLTCSHENYRTKNNSNTNINSHSRKHYEKLEKIG